MAISLYDWILIGILLMATVMGVFRGLASEVTSIASMIGSYVIAYQFRGALAQSIRADPPWNTFLAMLILFVVSSLILSVLVRMASILVNRLKLNEYDRHVGAVFGLVKGVLMCGLATLFAVTLCGERVRNTVFESRGGHAISNSLDRNELVVPTEVARFVRLELDQYDVLAAANEAIPSFGLEVIDPRNVDPSQLDLRKMDMSKFDPTKFDPSQLDPIGPSNRSR